MVIEEDVSSNEVFVKNTINIPFSNHSMMATNRWDVDNNVENKNVQQSQSQTFEDNHVDILALASFYDRPEYR